MWQSQGVSLCLPFSRARVRHPCPAVLQLGSFKRKRERFQRVLPLEVSGVGNCGNMRNLLTSGSREPAKACFVPGLQCQGEEFILNSSRNGESIKVFQ